MEMCYDNVSSNVYTGLFADSSGCNPGPGEWYTPWMLNGSSRVCEQWFKATKANLLRDDVAWIRSYPIVYNATCNSMSTRANDNRNVDNDCLGPYRYAPTRFVHVVFYRSDLTVKHSARCWSRSKPVNGKTSVAVCTSECPEYTNAEAGPTSGDMPVARPDSVDMNSQYLVFYRSDHKQPDLFVSDNQGPQTSGISVRAYRPDYVDVHSKSLSTAAPISIKNWQKAALILYLVGLGYFCVISARRYASL